MELTQKYKQERFNLSDTLSERMYNFIIGIVVCSGFGVNIVMATFFKEQIMSLSPIAVIIIYLIGTIGCMIAIYKCRNAMISYALFLLLAVCMGLLLVFYLSFYTSVDVRLAFIITTIITGAMLALACVYPGFFLSVGRGLFVALLLSVAVELIFGLLLRFEMGFMDYIFATIFSLYIGYDWARAQQYPKTADNAVDCAADLYIDITILFIRILSIVGDRD